MSKRSRRRCSSLVLRLSALLFLVPSGALALPEGLLCSAARAAPPEIALRGTVVDALTGTPLAEASVRFEARDGSPGPETLTDRSGSFVLAVPAGVAGRLCARHAAYEEGDRECEGDAAAAARDWTIRLRPRVFRVDEFLVSGDRVVPLSSGDETRYTFPLGTVRALGVDATTDLLRRLPGAVLLGDRPFFRGAGFEHVLPLLDGVPAREPIRGQWVLPPPDALVASELSPGGFDAEHGQALSGVFSVRLPDGGREHRAVAGVEGDHPFRSGGSGRRTGIARGVVSGPLRWRGLAYAAAWQARTEDTHLRYDHARPRQRVLGLDLGRHGTGDASGLLRISWADSARSLRSSLTLLQSEARTRKYHENYSRSGWVGYQPQYDRYTTFVDPATTSDSVVVFYDGPRSATTRFHASRLLQWTASLPLAARIDLQASLRAAGHRSSARAEGVAFADEAEARTWVREETTRPTHQVERFYALHGDYPEYEDGASEEAGVTARLRGRRGGHMAVLGGGMTRGRHRLFTAVPTIDWTPLGSLTQRMSSEDLHAYVQDTWQSDDYSSLTFAGRWDRQQLSGYLGDGSAATFSPRLSLRQPCGTRDALHVQAGVLYQFPPLLEHFQVPPAAQSRIALRAQRAKAFEIGLQHHFSPQAVGYVAVHVREYTDIVFTTREASEEDLLEPDLVAPESPVLETQGVEFLLDHQFHRSISGQLQLGISREGYGGTDAPWGRALRAGGWLITRPLAAMQLTVAWQWDSGRPYSVCIDPRTCSEETRYEGTLPDLCEVDLSGRWSLPGVTGLLLSLEVQNLLDRRVATFDFGVHGSSIGVANFIAYYDTVGKPGGYLISDGQQAIRHDIGNPQTLTAGRTARVGLEYDFRF